LYEQQASPRPPRLNMLALLAGGAKMIAGLLHTWLSDNR